MKTMMMLALLATSCAAQIQYDPQFQSAVPPTKFAKIEFVNARPPNQGGEDTRAVGIARGGYGNPMTFRQGDPNDLPRLIEVATGDALRSAGVDVKPDATNKLVAKVLQFWMDGYVGYTAWVEVEYSIVDAAGEAVWKQQVQGRQGGAVLSFGAASDLLSQALANMAREAAAKFQDPAFVAVLQ
jgi:hypothetical protein